MMLLLVKGFFGASFCDAGAVVVVFTDVAAVVVVLLQSIFKDLFPSFSFRQYINYRVTFPGDNLIKNSVLQRLLNYS